MDNLQRLRRCPRQVPASGIANVQRPVVRKLRLRWQGRSPTLTITSSGIGTAWTHLRTISDYPLYGKLCFQPDIQRITGEGGESEIRPTNYS